MTDNFNIIAAYIKSKNITDDMFFHISVMIRHKDVEWFPKGKDNNARTIYSINISSVEELYDHRKLITTLCNSLTARAYINLVPKSYSIAAGRALENATQNYVSKNYKGVQSSWSKGVNAASVKNESLYLIDIDEEDYGKTGDIYNFIYNLRPVGDKVVLQNNSKTGLHLICKKFDTKAFSEKYPNIDVKKNAMTILYCA